MKTSHFWDAPPPKKETATNAQTAALFVSLYVVILAFFIMLTTKAQFDVEKTEQAIRSVNKAFSKEQEITVEQFSASVGNETSVTQFFADIQTVVASFVPLKEVDVVTDGTLMRLTLPTSALFNKEDAKLRPGKQDFYRKLGNLLNQWQDSMQVDLSFIQGVEKTATRESAPASTIEITRAGNMAREMENRGAPPESITIGIRQGVPDTLFLEFFVRQMPTDAEPIATVPGGEVSP